MVRECVIAGKNVRLRASALIPRIYRHSFGRDMVTDMRRLQKAYNRALEASSSDATEEEIQDATLSVIDLEIFENVAWTMLLHGAEVRDVVTGKDDSGDDVVERILMNGDMVVGRSPDEWLDSLDGVFSVYEAMPIILELWRANQKTTSVPVKK